MRNLTFISILILLLVSIAAAVGVFYRTDEPEFEHLTVRGETARFHGNGLYKFDPSVLAKEGVIWDSVNLIIALPLFGTAILLSRRGSLRGRLLLGGLFFYFFYVYLMYATMMAFNPLFLVYVVIFALCPVAFAVNLHGIDLSGLPGRISGRFPKRLFIAYAFILAAALILLWSARIVPILITGRFPPELAGMGTLETQALDLGLIVPLAVSAGVLMKRGSPWGFLLTSTALTFGLLMCIAIPAWIAVPLIQEGKIRWIEASPFMVLCLTGIVLALLFLRSVKEK